MNKEKKIGTLVISNEQKIDLFRIHLYEKSIRFDEPLNEALEKNKDILEKIKEISNSWEARKINHRDVFYKVASTLSDYEKYLSKYYFTKEELDSKGRYVEPMPIDTFEGFLTKKEIVEHFNYLKKANKLTSISKKEFEGNIKDSNEEVINFYVDNYPRTQVEYYVYSTCFNEESENRSCFLLVVKEKILIGFEKK